MTGQSLDLALSPPLPCWPAPVPAQVVTGGGPNLCPCRRQEVEGRHLRVPNQGTRRDMPTQQAETIERDVLSSSDSAPVFSAAGYL